MDVLELGERPARCLKGENSPRGASIVAGRCHRGWAERLREKRRPYVMGRPPFWFQDVLLEKERANTEVERRRVKVRDKKIAALERQQAQIRSILRIDDYTSLGQ